MIYYLGNSSDASFYYHEDAKADTVARMDSAAVYGNLADAMRDAVVLFPSVTVTDEFAPVPSEDSGEDH